MLLKANRLNLFAGVGPGGAAGVPGGGRVRADSADRPRQRDRLRELLVPRATRGKHPCLAIATVI